MDGHGVGAALISAAEALARERARKCVGLAVELRNPRCAPQPRPLTSITRQTKGWPASG